MKRLVRFAFVLAAAMMLVPYLPFYVERTMMRSWLVNGPPYSLIEWGWKVCTLNSFWSNYMYFERETRPAFWLGVNLALASTYSLMIALIVDQILARLKRRRGRFR